MRSHTEIRGLPPADGGPRWRCSLVVGLVIASTLALGACRQDMHNQPKYRPLRATTFFADGSSARPLVEGTIARGTLQEDEAFFTGTAADALRSAGAAAAFAAANGQSW